MKNWRAWNISVTERWKMCGRPRRWSCSWRCSMRSHNLLKGPPQFRKFCSKMEVGPDRADPPLAAAEMTKKTTTRRRTWRWRCSPPLLSDSRIPCLWKMKLLLMISVIEAAINGDFCWKFVNRVGRVIIYGGWGKVLEGCREIGTYTYN